MMRTQGDLDEFWMPNVAVPENGSVPTLLDVVRSFPANESCKDWCFLTFPSHSIWRPMGSLRLDVNFRIAETFPIRKIDGAKAWQTTLWKKSIARTKNTFNSGC